MLFEKEKMLKTYIFFLSTTFLRFLSIVYIDGKVFMKMLLVKLIRSSLVFWLNIMCCFLHYSRVTRKELAYIVASIKPMEHCLVPFLKGCDGNGDNAIERAEWLQCLGIEHGKFHLLLKFSRVSVCSSTFGTMSLKSSQQLIEFRDHNSFPNDKF